VNWLKILCKTNYRKTLIVNRSDRWTIIQNYQIISARNYIIVSRIDLMIGMESDATTYIRSTQYTIC